MIRRALVTAFLLLVGTAFVPVAPRVASQPATPLIVIVGPSVPGDDIGLGTLRNAYEGYPTDFNGRRIVPFHFATDSEERRRFDRAVLGLGPEQAARFWVDQRVRRGVQPPRGLTSTELVMKVVASLPGAVGYLAVPPSSVPAPLRVLSVEGEQPGAPKYPL